MSDEKRDPRQTVQKPDEARGTVLLVEEEANVRSLLAKLLGERGYVFLEAKDADEALKRCEEHAATIDLMICDLLMPQQSGVELARRCRAFHPNLKTLYLSAHSESSMIYRGIPITHISFLPKPFKLRELIGQVDALLSA
jgi:two-component system cell cycle sensor histidine kinase/response regulator CckA